MVISLLVVHREWLLENESGCGVGGAGDQSGGGRRGRGDYRESQLFYHPDGRGVVAIARRIAVDPGGREHLPGDKWSGRQWDGRLD